MLVTEDVFKIVSACGVVLPLSNRIMDVLTERENSIGTSLQRDVMILVVAEPRKARDFITEQVILKAVYEVTGVQIKRERLLVSEPLRRVVV